jgi:uncharacterized protein YegL
MSNASGLREFTVSQPRPLPVFVLADVSTSMEGAGKIGALNQSVRDMIEAFTKESEARAQIHLAVITFGGTARLHTPLQPAAKVTWQDMRTDGNTPMGAAMAIAKKMIEDRQLLPSRAYRPTVILVSDGQPNDEGWEKAMESLIHDGRSAKADRLALAIGSDADEAMLKTFLGDPSKTVFHAEDAAGIRKFFRFVTMSVQTRSRSVNPNATGGEQGPAAPKIDDL